MNQPTILTYSGCGTCRKATAWLKSHQIAFNERPIVDEPPTIDELTIWIPRSGLGIRKWLNTSGQSYRAMGKAKVDAATDAEILKWLAADGKLIKRPVLVTSKRILVGFREEDYAAVLQT